MTRDQPVLALIKAGLFRGRWGLDDDSYDAMSPEFVMAAWKEWVKSLPPELTETVNGQLRPRHIPEVLDCDNRAKLFGCFITLCMAVDAARRGITRGNAASGKFNYVRADGTPHAVNWFITHEGVARTFEPQIGAFDFVTTEEAETIDEGESI